MVVIVPREAYDTMAEHARAAYPDECCGLLSGPEAEAGVLVRAHPCANLQNRYHERFPDDYPRDARTAYLLDYRDLERTDGEVRAQGHRVKGIFHSHIDVGAYFSAEDKVVALMGGEEPLLADFVHIILDAQANSIEGAKAFLWNPPARDFLEVELRIES